MNAEVEQRAASLRNFVLIGLKEPDVGVHLEQVLWWTLQARFSLRVQVMKILQQCTHALSLNSSPEVEEVAHCVE